MQSRIWQSLLTNKKKHTDSTGVLKLFCVIKVFIQTIVFVVLLVIHLRIEKCFQVGSANKVILLHL